MKYGRIVPSEYQVWFWLEMPDKCCSSLLPKKLWCLASQLLVKVKELTPKSALGELYIIPFITTDKE